MDGFSAKRAKGGESFKKLDDHLQDYFIKERSSASDTSLMLPVAAR
jgi:hypothetical protein